MKILDKKTLKNNKGFSLIEIIISLSILGVLAFYGYSSLIEYYKYANILSTRNTKYTSLIDEINNVVLERFKGLYSSVGEQRLPIQGGNNTEELCKVDKIEDTFGTEIDGFSGVIGTIRNETINIVSSWLYDGIDENTSRNIGTNNFNYKPTMEQVDNEYWREYNKCINRQYAATVTNSDFDNKFNIEFCIAVEPSDPENIDLVPEQWISMQPIFIKYIVKFKNPDNRNDVSCNELENFERYLAEVEYTVYWINSDSSDSSDSSYKSVEGIDYWNF